MQPLLLNTDPAALPLREIHLPGSVGWWPPAPGWWLLPCLMALAAILAWYFSLLYRRRKYSAVNMARKELDGIRARYAADRDTSHCVEAVSGLLRRLCISVFPRAETAGLTGNEWLVFLQERMKPQESAGESRDGPGIGEGEGLSNLAGVLLEAPYRRQVGEAEAETLIGFCSDWIETVAAPGKSGPAGMKP